MTMEQVNLALFSTDILKEPTTYEEAMNSEQKEDQIKWKNVISKELNEMEKRGVWEVIDEKNIPIDCRCLKSKWIFKVHQINLFLICRYVRYLHCHKSKYHQLGSRSSKLP
jgi:hypothetical protein